MTLIARKRQVLAALVTLAAALGIAAPAQATFPGANGRIAYTWSRGGEDFDGGGPIPHRVGIVSVRPNGEGRRLVARGATQPAYSPDGDRIAFLRGRLWVARADGRSAHPVTPSDWSVGQHTWSPRGTRLAFERTFRNSGGGALYTVRSDGTGLKRLLKTPLGMGLSSGAWSPDGKAIVYDQNSAGRPLVRIFRAGEITTLARPAFESTWSRRGLIAYETLVSAGDRNEVCIKSPDPKATPGCIGFADASVSDPAWSPNGRRLMVMYTPHQGQGEAEIWTVRPDGTVLTRAPRGNVFPIFSPDGKLFAFNRSRFAGQPPLEYEDLFVMHPDGTGTRRVVRGGQVNSPDWQPLPLR
jgi:dipeptidyl aminopeptidase/acylaminoacyl peptidase